MKKLCKIVGRLLLHGIILGIIWLDTYYFNVNEWVAIGIVAAWIIGVRVLESMMQKRARKEKSGDAKGTGKRAGKIFYWVFDGLILLFIVISTLFNPYWNGNSHRVNASYPENGSTIFSKKDALSDYEFMMKYVKKVHPLALGGLPADVEKRAREVKEWIGAQDEIEGYVLARELESILSLLGDGHTMVEENYGDYHVMKHVYEHNKAGDTLVGINGVTFEEFLAQHPTIVSFETESFGIRMIKNRITRLEGLRYLGVDISGEITYNYVTENGEETTEVVRAEDFLLMEDYLAYEEEVTGDNLHEDEDRGFVYYDVDEEHSLAILTLNSCRANKTYEDTLKKMFEEIHEKGIQNVCVDLRYNGGGSSLVGNEFIEYLDVDEYMGWGEELRVGSLLIKTPGSMIKNHKKKQVFTGNVYILTGVRSYSAAMDFAMLIKDNGLGKIVGKPCGNMPDSYGQVVSFKLPKTGMYMQVSMKKWYRVDMSKNGEPLMPDVECPEDKALEVLLDSL